MFRKIASLTFIILLFACSEKSKIPQEVESETKQKKSFRFEDFSVSKGRLGNIQLGMKISSLKNQLSFFDSKKVDAIYFGFDGGGKANIYLFDKEPLFALVTALETDSIIAIIGLHKKLFFNSGIHVGMSVKETVSLYPKCIVEQNLMMNWEEIYDEKNNFIFVFKTDVTNRIGNYT